MKNTTKEMGIVVLASNAYFVLGLRLLRRWDHFYKGNHKIKFYFFSDKNPKEYLPENIDVEFHEFTNKSWVDGTNSKFVNILKLKNCSSKFLYYLDADTNIQKEFTEYWMLGIIVGGEHYGNRTFLSNGKGFDRNIKGNSFVPENSPHKYTYYYGAFFGGLTDKVIEMCTMLRTWQKIDQENGYEPPVNDESYINKYFHYNPPTTVSIEDFKFVVSDKGGLGDTRKIDLNVSTIESSIKENKNKLWDIQNGKIKYENT